jgi:phage terminase large subunit
MGILANYKTLFAYPNPTRYFLITGGRGSGKSYSVTYSLLRLTYREGHIILFTRWTLVSAHISIIPEFIEKIELMQMQSNFVITKDEIINTVTGSKIIFKGIKSSPSNFGYNCFC